VAIQQVVHIDAQVTWNILRTSSGKYVAVCDPLRLTLQADSLDDLAEDIAIALDAFLKDLIEADEIDKFLREHGWMSAVPIPRRVEDVRFEVPFYLAMQAGHGSANRVHQ